ncbi:MAG: sulfotransferase domain-containing protein [Pirellulaceae bacterium]
MNQVPLHFVISAPRSGSTWLTSAINRHPEIAGVEQRLFGGFCEMWKNPRGNLTPRITLDCYARGLSYHWMIDETHEQRSETSHELTQAMIQALGQLAALNKTGKSTLVDKITPYSGTASTVLEQISRHAPQSKIIHLVRDGRDVVTSLVFDWINREPPESLRRQFFVDRTSGTKLTRFFSDDDLKKWCDQWLDVENNTQAANATLEVRYENLKTQFGIELFRIFQFLNLPLSDESIAQIELETNFQQMTGRVAGQAEATAKARKGVVGDWSNYFTRHDAQLFDAIAGQTLLELGYVAEPTWWKSCPEELCLTLA